MKQPLVSLLLSYSYLLLLIPLFAYAAHDFDVVLEPLWLELGNSKKAEEFGGKWMLVGSIIFKKRIKDPVCIGTIILRWSGDRLDNLIASLYKKNLNKEFLPIEDNLICDGSWNKSKQLLILNFEEQESLGPTTIYYLVLTVPESLEPLLKTGSFCIDQECLPFPFQQCAHNKNLSLAVNSSQKSIMP